MTDPQTRQLRAKMLGALMREVRLENGKSLTEIAELLGISTSTLSSYEHGRKSISLPELEVLAYHLDTPLGLFLDPSPEDLEEGRRFDPQIMMTLRQRMIGAQLRQARDDQNITQKSLAEAAEMPVSRVSAYERGERSVPIPDLESLVKILGCTIDDFIDEEGPIGEWLGAKTAFENFMALPDELRAFFNHPDRLPYLRMAQRLSELDLGDLRAVSEALQELIP
ncbi:MAG: helix-turn-helix transcriptional regulator [Anaerolineales bacterium]|jgi:transcriptional regulator with XRE-family HTH domain